MMSNVFLYMRRCNGKFHALLYVEDRVLKLIICEIDGPSLLVNM